MQPVEIDVVRLQATERLLALRQDRLAARAAAVGIAEEHVRRELRREDDAIPLPPIVREVLAEDGLGVALRVAVRGVDEVAAPVDVVVEDALRVSDLGAPPPLLAERHRPEAERADAKPAGADGEVVSDRHARGISRSGGAAKRGSRAAPPPGPDQKSWRAAGGARRPRARGTPPPRARRGPPRPRARRGSAARRAARRTAAGDPSRPRRGSRARRRARAR